MDGKIKIDWQEYLDRLLANLRLEFDLKLSALKEEYKKSEKQIGEAKAEVDAHFNAVNGLQVRMDKMSQTFLTGKDADEKIKLAVANMSGLGIQIKVIWVLLTALILLLISLLAKEYIGS
jgi:hypothetical protein